MDKSTLLSFIGLVGFVWLLLVVPAYFPILSHSWVGRTLLVVAVVGLTATQPLLGLLAVLLTVLYEPMVEGMTSSSSVPLKKDDSSSSSAVGIDKEDIRSAIAAKPSKAIPVMKPSDPHGDNVHASSKEDFSSYASPF